LDVEDALIGTIAETGSNLHRELELIFDRMLKMDRGDLGQSAKNPFHVSQTYLILDNIGELFTTFVDRLEAAAVDTEPE
jgi:nuclear pore complex protein Nup107